MEGDNFSNQSPGDLEGLRKLLGEYDAMVYQAVKEGRTAGLSGESHIFAKVIQEHLEFPHVHNALEFSDVRDGHPYMVGGVSPVAHLKMHAAVEEMIEGGNSDVKTTFEKLLVTGTGRHHAIHIIGALFLKYYVDAATAVQSGESPEKAERTFKRSLKKISTDASFRKKMTQTVDERHGFGD